MKQNKRLKAQSSIEYLTTYGFMFIAVGLMSSVAFQYINTPCSSSQSGFLGQSAEITDYGISSDGDFQFVVENGKSRKINITGIRLEHDGTEMLESFDNKIVSPYKKKTLDGGGGIETGDRCTTFKLEVFHELGNISQQKSAGEITMRSGLEENEPLAPDNISVQN